MSLLLICSVVAFQRTVLKPITLSDGTYLPAGTRAFVPSVAISSDASIYQNPDHFDGLRFYNLRQRSAEDENKYQFTSTGKTQMHFGGGRHACPGRWFASHEIKLILTTLLSQYDLKLKEGEGRPKNILFQSQLNPDPRAEILFKSV
jgi:cytochrome P450